MNFDVYYLVILALPLMFGITVHEAAHGIAAKYCGDNTAQMLGRLTLNPIKHIDPIGTVAFPLMMYLFSSTLLGGAGFLFGWAKPVPVNSRNYTRFSYRKSDFIVSFAGPASNLIMLFIWSWIAVLSAFLPMPYGDVVSDMAGVGVILNAVLFTLNMIPIFPLDGGHVLDTLLPPSWSIQFRKLNLGRYGFFIVLLLISMEPTRTLFHESVMFVAKTVSYPASWVLSSVYN